MFRLALSGYISVLPFWGGQLLFGGSLISTFLTAHESSVFYFGASSPHLVFYGFYSSRVMLPVGYCLGFFALSLGCLGLALLLLSFYLRSRMQQTALKS
jgi:hypothetical protein